MLTAVVLSVGNIVDNIVAWRENGRFMRLFTSYGISCLYSSYFLYTLPFLTSFTLFHPSGKIRLLTLGGTFISGIAFLLQYSRGTWLSFFIALLLSGCIFRKIKKRVFVSSFLLLFCIFSIPLFKNRLFSVFTLNPYKWGDRMVLWKGSLNIFKQHWLLGAGVGSYEILLYKYINPKNLRDKVIDPVSGKPIPAVHAHAHNMYLEILSEMGILGLLSFLFIFIFFLRVYYYRLKMNFNYYAFSFWGMVVSVLLNNLTGSTILVGVNNSFLFWFLLGLSNFSFGNKNPDFQFQKNKTTEKL
jgi:O-antigen ligase